jgi:sterol desaturase/sphingolipid hydroxylase (fatty acid hydroxylase superfamily)
LEPATPWYDLIALWRALPLEPTQRLVLRTVLLGLALLAIVHLLERLHRIAPPRYRSSAFLHDLVYWFYYRLGLHYVIFLAAAFAALSQIVPAVDLLGGLPFAVQALLYFALIDLVQYWMHRALHSVPWLWAFHAVHHSQRELSFATSQRFHPLDRMLQDILMFIPLRLLGFDEGAWIPLYVLGELNAALQHSRVPWGYGPLYRVIVSPEFHRYHHGEDPAYHHSNFAGLFSFWDYVFGTAARRAGATPVRLGVAGLEHRHLLDSLLGPFRQLRRRPVPVAAMAPLEPHVRD